MKSTRVLVAAFLLLTSDGLASSQTRQPAVFSTPPQKVVLKVRTKGSTSRELKATVGYTITSARVDDTLTGTVSIAFLSKSRKGKASDPPSFEHLAGIPPTISSENVTASFSKNTSCPKLKIEISTIDFDVAGEPGTIEAFSIVLAEKRDDEMSQLLCFWTSQINGDRARRGIVGRINRLIQGEDPAQ